MKALTLTQPWASLVILGGKRWETRGWSTAYRGPLAIHAAKGWTRDDIEFAVDLQVRGILPVDPESPAWALQPMPRGAVLGTVELLSVHRSEQMHPSPLEAELGDYSPGRWVWVLANPMPFPEPIPARGALGLWEWERPS